MIGPGKPIMATTATFSALLLVGGGLTSATASSATDARLGPFTWGEKTHVADAGWGRMIRLADDRYLCVEARFPRPNSLLELKLSDDNARTWTTVGEVTEPGRNLDNGEILQLPSGDILLTGRSVVSSRVIGSVQSYHLPVYRSGDFGKTWTFQSQVDMSEPPPYQKGQPSMGLWEPHFFLLPDGKLACAYANEKHALDQRVSYSQVVSECVSGDSGVTWGPEIVVAAQVGGGNQRPGMPVMTRLRDGKFATVFEVVGIGDADVYYKTSVDGVTWDPGIGTRVPCQRAGPWITTLADGRLVVSSCTNRVSISDDNGATWRLTTPPPWPDPDGHLVFTWPAIYQISPTEIAVMKTHDGVDIRWGQIAPPETWPSRFASDFRRSSDTGWTVYGGLGGVASSTYVLDGGVTTAKSLTGSSTWRDGVLEAELTLQPVGSAGVLFRVTNADYAGPDAAAGYYAGLDTNGGVTLRRMGSHPADLARATIAAGATGKPHRIRVALHGNHIAVYVDDITRPTLSATDTAYPQGQVGVRADHGKAGFTSVRWQSEK